MASLWFVTQMHSGRYPVSCRLLVLNPRAEHLPEGLGSSTLGYVEEGLDELRRAEGWGRRGEVTSPVCKRRGSGVWGLGPAHRWGETLRCLHISQRCPALSWPSQQTMGTWLCLGNNPPTPHLPPATTFCLCVHLFGVTSPACCYSSMNNPFHCPVLDSSSQSV